jgi:NHLM bacteriocin system ABC transporter ATP-binding protein
MIETDVHVSSESDLQEQGAFRMTRDHIWIVESERLDVFLAPIDDGHVAGRRTHLFRVSEGEPLFGIDDSGLPADVSLSAVGTGDTYLTRLDRSALKEGGTDDRDGLDDLPGLLDRWLDTLAATLEAERTVPTESTGVTGDDVKNIPANTAVRGRTGVWVRHERGTSRFAGSDRLCIDERTGYLPLPDRFWLKTETECDLSVTTTRDITDPGALWSGIDRFQELFLQTMWHIQTQAKERERSKLGEQVEHRLSAVNRAFRDLASVFRSNEDERRAPASDDPVIGACRAIGDYLDLEIEAPPERETGHAYEKDPLQSIAQASGIRIRKVALRGQWWEEDAGPLLGLTDDEQRPVSLLPTAPGEYELFDPEQGTRHPVDQEKARTLHPFAYTFYEPLPDEKLSLTDVLDFGLSSCRKDLLLVLLAGMGGGLLSMASPIVTGQIVNSVIPAADQGQLFQLTLALIVCAVVSGLFRLSRSIALVRVQGKVRTSTQAAVWDRLLNLPLSFFRRFSAGELAKRTMGIGQIQQILSGPTLNALLGATFSIFNFGLLFYYSVELALWATLLCVVAGAAIVLGNVAQLTYQRQITDLENQISNIVLQFLDGISKLRVAGAEAKAFSIWADEFTEKRKLQFRKRRIKNGLTTFKRVFPLFSLLVIFAAAIPMVTGSNTSISTGDFVAFTAALTAFLNPLLSMSSALANVLRVIPLYENAQPILETLPEVQSGNSDPGELDGRIEMQHVSFRYDEDDPLVIDDVSLKIDPGEMVAFVGPSGSGKSTLLRLLLGFEQPAAGTIYYDHQDMAGLDTQALRRQIGVVLQDGKLMPGDLHTNIVGSSMASQEEAWKAARMAGIAEDIDNMPMGMNTVVSQGGSTLSGGQKQRLMIARAVVDHPRILYFDEATSDLDNNTQAAVNDSLERLEATRIVVAHRLSTIRNADRIYVLQDGRLVEQGPYEELLDADGLFAALARRQLA